MALVFGGASTDAVTAFNGAFSMQGTGGGHGLMSMWLKPTTLTAGRCAYGFGTAGRLEVHTTTSEFVMQQYQFTAPNHRQVTSGLGMVTGEWLFLAIWWPSGVSLVPRVWAGRETTAPVEVSTSVLVAGGGGGVASGAPVIGNRNSTEGTTVAWQGLIDDFRVLWKYSASTQISPLGPLVNLGSIMTQDEADATLNNFVIPAWMGLQPYAGHVEGSSATLTSSAETLLGFGGEAGAYYRDRAPGQVNTPVWTPGTITGTLTTLERGPRSLSPQPAYVRR